MSKGISTPVATLLSVCILLAIGCGSSDSEIVGGVVSNTGSGLITESEPDAVEFQLEQVFGTEDGPLEQTLAEPISVTADRNGNVYVLDLKDSRLVSFDKDGVYRWTAGQAGQGPGEFEYAYTVVAGESGLYVTNAMGTRIDLFSFDGDYVDSTPVMDYGLEQRGSLIGFFSPTNPVFVSAMLGKTGAAISVFDTAADSVLMNLTIDQSEDFPLPSGFAITPDLALSRGTITSGHVSKFLQTYYTETGENARAVTRDINSIVLPGVLTSDNGSASMRIFSLVGAPYSVGANHWLSISRWPTNVTDPTAYMRMDPESRPKVQQKYSADLYDNSGRLLWSRLYDGESPIGDIDSAADDGSLYTIVDSPFPQVRRYRVRLNGSLSGTDM